MSHFHHSNITQESSAPARLARTRRHHPVFILSHGVRPHDVWLWPVVASAAAEDGATSGLRSSASMLRARPIRVTCCSLCWCRAGWNLSESCQDIGGLDFLSFGLCVGNRQARTEESFTMKGDQNLRVTASFGYNMCIVMDGIMRQKRDK